MPKRLLFFTLTALLSFSQLLLPAAALSDELTGLDTAPSAALIDVGDAPAAPPSLTVEISPSPEDLPPEMTEETPPAETMPSDETSPPQTDPVPEETPPEASSPLDGADPSETPPAPEETEPSETEEPAPGETAPPETEEPAPGETAPPETEEPAPGETTPPETEEPAPGETAPPETEEPAPGETTPPETEEPAPSETPPVPSETAPTEPSESPEVTAPPEAVPLPAEPPADPVNEPTYIVKIPPEIDFGEIVLDEGPRTCSFTISAQDVSGLGSMELNVVVESTNGFCLLPTGEDSDGGAGGLAYQIYTGEDPWSSGEVVASFREDADISCTAVLDTSQAVHGADYSDTLTFAFVLAPSSPPEEQAEEAPDQEAPFASTSQLESE